MIGTTQGYFRKFIFFSFVIMVFLKWLESPKKKKTQIFWNRRSRILSHVWIANDVGKVKISGEIH